MTVMIKNKHAVQSNIYKVTGWTFMHEVNESVFIKERETHISQNNIHKIFINRKLKIINVGLKFLLLKGIFKTSSQLELHIESLKISE